ncbi:hypothetical protein NPIL_699651 [Nephila pilipes]|uniref:Uncharacterized protein n=1 Tax=Nephila pilipes TaxID=299642 RepID=A0A8X6PEP1_NEPPI|nr:hypothetical protein NPIL_699651 [Nephila pilipes]
MITTHQNPLEQYLDSQVPELKEESPSSVTDAGLQESSSQSVLPARESMKTETAVNCMTLFNLNSNSDPSSSIVLRIFGEKIAVRADTSASHTIAGEKLFKFLQEHDIIFAN